MTAYAIFMNFYDVTFTMPFTFLSVTYTELGDGRFVFLVSGGGRT